VDWGDAPAWISSVGTSLSLLLAFFIILRDRARARAAQAAKIACWERRPITHHIHEGVAARLSVNSHDVWLNNASGLPVTDAAVLSRTLTKREARRRYSAQELAAFEKQLEELNEFLADATLAVDGSEDVGVVMPNETASISLLGHNEEQAAGPFVRAWVYFRDVSGMGWFRDLETGNLLRARRWSTRLRLAGGLLRASRQYKGPQRQAYRHWLRNP
jgi:hypothetical protein